MERLKPWEIVLNAWSVISQCLLTSVNLRWLQMVRMAYSLCITILWRRLRVAVDNATYRRHRQHGFCFARHRLLLNIPWLFDLSFYVNNPQLILTGRNVGLLGLRRLADSEFQSKLSNHRQFYDESSSLLFRRQFRSSFVCHMDYESLLSMQLLKDFIRATF